MPPVVSSPIYHLQDVTCENIDLTSISLNAVDYLPHSWAPSCDTFAADDSNVSSADTYRINNLESDTSFSNDDIRAQLDTGAMVTCTNLLHVFHDFRYYDTKFPCRKRLTGAIDKSVGILPLGEGTLHVPAINRQGYVAVKCLYSPHLTSTLLSENDILFTSGDAEHVFSG